jgi:hypothetical protein
MQSSKMAVKASASISCSSQCSSDMMFLLAHTIEGVVGGVVLVSKWDMAS